MTKVNKTTWGTLFANGGGGYFPTNNTQEIGSDDIRKQNEDLRDSVPFYDDDAYSFAKSISPGINTIAGLKAIVTASLSVGVVIAFRDTGNSNVLRVYELVTGTDAEVSPTIIRPTDYAGTTNEKVWKLCDYSIDGGSL